MSRTKLLVSLITVLLLGAAAVGGYGLWQKRTQQAQGEQFRIEQLDRGEIVQIISANGTVNPVVMVNVGTQVSGTLQKIHVDFNAQVREGQILAELDPRLLQAQVDQDEANLASGQANLKLQQANWKRLKTLYEQEYISRADFDAATQAREAAEAQVALQQAQLRRSRTNLSYTIIRSPVSGIVVSRLVDVGQTVAASFQTPVLFQIAKDLGQMQIDTSVAEADLGNVHLGQEVQHVAQERDVEA
ncbi:MAG TPA: efflux RND transporter periplasmic adaptor subunit, partial [Pseudomonadales bacterium]|nr:efflux RND transporter periplasmic adaptor subunit [Pseudomonadales bacterium]